MIKELVCALSCSALLAAQSSEPAWVGRSNQNAEVLLKVLARYEPEATGRRGMNGLDQEVSVPAPDVPARLRADLTQARRELESRLKNEKDPLVVQDLNILIKAADRRIRMSETEERLLIPYLNAPRIVFTGIKALLDEQVPADRHAAALVRLRRYAGLEKGYTPLVSMAEQRFREKENQAGLVGPSRIEVEKDLQDTDTLINGIGLLCERYKVSGYEQPYAKLKDQVAEYRSFLQKDVLPHCRSDFRLPAEIYRNNLENFGVDFEPAELATLAHKTFAAIQLEMQRTAVMLVKERHLPSDNYRDVIRVLKNDQLRGDAVLPHYQKRLAQIEDVIRQQHLLTLPSRPAIIRIATAAETAVQPAPHMDPPPLINNRGARGVFVLPLGTNTASGQQLKYDDFTFEAGSWTLTAHEARPGHELQFDAMVERGVSLARAIFAFNSTNVEGWGLYAEYIMLPFMPDDGKLISLQLRLLRAARAFLDPELQSGKVTRDQAMQVLTKDVVCSEAFATEEVDRFMFRSPGQAVSYFDGYVRLRTLRADVEQNLGERFNAQRYHDFILAQGLLPPDLLRQTVLAEFLKPSGAAATGR